MCKAPTALPLVRLAQKSATAGGPDYGLDKLMSDGSCMGVGKLGPFAVDFQEDITWA